MKKVLFILTASAFFAACNDSSTTETDTMKDSTMVSDSTMMTPPPAPMDTTMMGDSSKMMNADTMMKK